MNQISTIKLHKSTKSALDNLKDKFESYDKTIKRLISSVENSNLRAELIDAYKSMGKEDLQYLEEWNHASKEMESYV